MDKKSKIIIILTVITFIILFGYSIYAVFSYNHKNAEQSDQEQSNGEPVIYYLNVGEDFEINLINDDPVTLYYDASDIQNDTIMNYTWRINNITFGYGINISFQIQFYMASYNEIRLITIDDQNNTNDYVSELIIRK